MLRVKQAVLYQSLNWSGLVLLNGFIPLNALERLPFALKLQCFSRVVISLVCSSNSYDVSALDQKDARGFHCAQSGVPYQ